MNLPSTSRTNTFVAAILVIVFLYMAREVLIPLALALLLTFLLAPAVQKLQQLRIHRLPAVLITAVLTSALIGMIGWIIVTQTLALVASLPGYKNNIQTKIVAMQKNLGLGLQKTTGPIEEFIKEIQKLVPPKLDKRKVVPVEVVEPPENFFQILSAGLIPLFKPLGKAAVVIIFVIFMLFKREDLKDRLFRIVGSGRLHLTMEALDEAGRRVSRYLLMQTLINGSQGIVVALGLLVIGVPNAILWGFLSAVLRFIPYVGPWLAAGLPIVLSFAVFDSWLPSFLVISLFVVLELITNNVIEPWLYGTHTGVSSFALIVAVVFWTSIWGLAGLLLSTPLTVCLVVIGKYVPQLKFLNIMLGDEPGLDPQSRFYQRLVAANREEADEIVDDFLKEKDLPALYDGLLIPALGLAEKDKIDGGLSGERHTFILESIREIAEECAERVDKKTEDQPLPTGTDLKLLCLPARTEADEISAMMFTQLAEKLPHVEASYLSATSLLGEMLNQVKELNPDILCVCSLPPSSVSKARYSQKKIHASFQNIQVLVGLWGLDETVEKAKERLESAEKAKLQIVINFREGLSQVEQSQLSKIP
ncbi:MAG TPA: AI-2E family transporter [Acidobacteriota bacterium]|nr:AI-2E family transporter [Acidobacteriota bacterium]